MQLGTVPAFLPLEHTSSSCTDSPMRYLRALATILLFGCATAAHRQPAPGTVGFTREVTGLGMYSKDLPARYRRLQDTPGRVWVLWSQQHMCVVNEDLWMRTNVGDRVPCQWRLPR